MQAGEEVKPVKARRKKGGENSSNPKLKEGETLENVPKMIWEFAKSKSVIPGVALDEMWNAIALAKKELGR